MINVSPISAQCLVKPISVTSTASTSTALPAIGNSIVVCNEGPNVAFVSIGTGTQVATLPNATPTRTSTPILPGYERTFSIANPGSGGAASPTPLNISAICRASGTATLDVYVGEGA